MYSRTRNQSQRVIFLIFHKQISFTDYMNPTNRSSGVPSWLYNMRLEERRLFGKAQNSGLEQDREIHWQFRRNYLELRKESGTVENPSILAPILRPQKAKNIILKDLPPQVPSEKVPLYPVLNYSLVFGYTGL